MLPENPKIDGSRNFDNLKKRHPPRDDNYDSDVSDAPAKVKDLKKKEENNLDHNYDNLIDDSMQVKLNSRKVDPSFDQGSYLPNNYIGNQLPYLDYDMPIQSDDEEIDDERDAQSDQGPDMTNL